MRGGAEKNTGYVGFPQTSNDGLSEPHSSPFKVVAYDRGRLGELFGGHHLAYARENKATPHVAYFRHYFDELKPLTIVVEERYVDHDYLEDYTGFYARCFAEYPRLCSRLHFFSVGFSDADFRALLCGNEGPLNEAALRDAYAGFIVLKPLPETVIGRTCLRPYQEGQIFDRQFPITRVYRVNLFGIPLEVTSLAFQEQDKAAAACASSAIWSALQGTGHLFHHAIPSPIEITRAATQVLPLESRSLPNDGLTPPQMSAAIRAAGLECDAISVTDLAILKRSLYAYLRGRIPLLLGVQLYDSQRGGAELGRHATAVVGYHLDKLEPWVAATQEFRLRAERIDKFYVHDDQVGPFARMVPCCSQAAKDAGFDATRMPLSEIACQAGVETNNLWLTRWRRRGGEEPAGVVAVPYLLILPLYHKIRLSFDSVLNMVRSFDQFLEWMHGRRSASARQPKALINLVPEPLEWDIYLCNNEDFRKDARGHIPAGEQRIRMMTAGLPRFVWRAIGYAAGGVRTLGLLFDATDVPQGRCLLMAIEYRKTLLYSLRYLLHHVNVYEEAETSEEGRVLAWFKNVEPARSFITVV